MPKYSLEKLQVLANAKGMAIDVVQTTPHPIIYIFLLKHPDPEHHKKGNRRAVENPATGLPNFYKLSTVHKFLTT